MKSEGQVQAMTAEELPAPTRAAKRQEEEARRRADQEAEAEIAQLAEREIASWQPVLEDALPAGVTVQQWLYRVVQRAKPREVQPGARLDLGGGITVEVYRSQEGWDKAVVAPTRETYRLGGQLRAALARYYERTAKELADQEARERQDEERRRERERLDAERRAILRDADAELLALRPDVPPHEIWWAYGGATPWTSDDLNQYRHNVALAKAEWLQAHHEAQVRARLEERVAELEVLDRDIRVYRVVWPTAFSGECAEYRTEYSVLPSPEHPDDEWPFLAGDELRRVRVMNLHGAVTIEQVWYPAGTRIRSLPPALRATEVLEEEGVRVAFERLSVWLLEEDRDPDQCAAPECSARRLVGHDACERHLGRYEDARDWRAKGDPGAEGQRDAALP